MLLSYLIGTHTAGIAADTHGFNLGMGQTSMFGPIKTNNSLHRLKTQNNLTELFNKYFKVVAADTPKMLLQAYRLRYEVYCKEGLISGFRPEDYPEGLEFDQYDERSVHSLLIHKPSGLIAGTVRMILPDQDKPYRQFPLEKIATESFYTDIESLENLPRSHLGEISRLIIAPEFRGRWRENQYPHGIAEDSEFLFQKNNRCEINTPKPDSDYRKIFQRRAFPHPVLGLFVAIVQMSIKHGLKYWYAGMEQGVAAKFYRIFGIDFMPISPIVDYYGPCRGYLGYIPDIMNSIYQTNPEVWVLLTNDGKILPA